MPGVARWRHYGMEGPEQVEYVRRMAEVGSAHRKGPVRRTEGYSPRPTDPERGRRLVIRLSLEVKDGEIRLEEEVQAESIERAVRLAVARYPRCEVRVLFPIDPKTFFATEDGFTSGAAPSEAGMLGQCSKPGRLGRPYRSVGFDLDVG